MNLILSSGSTVASAALARIEFSNQGDGTFSAAIPVKYATGLTRLIRVDVSSSAQSTKSGATRIMVKVTMPTGIPVIAADGATPMLQNTTDAVTAHTVLTIPKSVVRALQGSFGTDAMTSARAQVCLARTLLNVIAGVTRNSGTSLGLATSAIDGDGGLASATVYARSVDRETLIPEALTTADPSNVKSGLGCVSTGITGFPSTTGFDLTAIPAYDDGDETGAQTDVGRALIGLPPVGADTTILDLPSVVLGDWT